MGMESRIDSFITCVGVELVSTHFKGGDELPTGRKAFIDQPYAFKFPDLNYDYSN